MRPPAICKACGVEFSEARTFSIEGGSFYCGPGTAGKCTLCLETMFADSPTLLRIEGPELSRLINDALKKGEPN